MEHEGLRNQLKEALITRGLVKREPPAHYKDDPEQVVNGNLESVITVLLSTVLGNPSDELLTALGFEKRYRLVGHPAWPDPLQIIPATEEQARKVWEEHSHPNAWISYRWVAVGQATAGELLPPRSSED